MSAALKPDAPGTRLSDELFQPVCPRRPGWLARRFARRGGLDRRVGPWQWLQHSRSLAGGHRPRVTRRELGAGRPRSSTRCLVRRMRQATNDEVRVMGVSQAGRLVDDDVRRSDLQPLEERRSVSRRSLSVGVDSRCDRGVDRRGGLRRPVWKAGIQRAFGREERTVGMGLGHPRVARTRDDIAGRYSYSSEMLPRSADAALTAGIP